MKLASITYVPNIGRVSYNFIFANEVKTYFANVSDDNGIRGISCEPDLEALLLEAQAKNSNAVKTLSKVTWNVIDGVGVEFPIVL